MSGILGGKTESKSGVLGSFTEDNYVNIGKMRIGFLSESLDGTANTGSVPGDNADAAGRYTNDHTISYTGFASAPWIYACIESDAHEPHFSCVATGISTTSATFRVRSGREIYIEGETIRILVVGEAL